MAGVQLTCKQCGQTDDHPKVHVASMGAPGGEDIVYHHDCLPYDLRQQVVDSAEGDSGKNIIEACEGGLKGDDLRTFIVTGKKGGK